MRSNIVIVQEREDMWFSGSLDFDGVTSMGNTKEEARENIELILIDMLLHKEINMSEAKNTDDEKYIKSIYDKKMKYVLSDIDLKDYIGIDSPEKSVRTNVSIKKGYKVLAKAKGIRISDVLNKALSKELKVTF